MIQYCHFLLQDQQFQFSVNETTREDYVSPRHAELIGSGKFLSKKKGEGPASRVGMRYANAAAG